MSDRLESILKFIIEVDKLKEIQRRSYLISGSRLENSAEHSWHLSLMTLLLAEFSNVPIDVPKVMRMVIVHDLVEIDAGDTFCYDTEGNCTKAERETLAADRLFGLLPEDQAGDLRGLWEEFERAETAEARFAGAIDRLMPVLHNLRNGGRGWSEHGVKYDQVFERNSVIAHGSEALWTRIKQELEKALQDGILTR